MTKKKKKQMKCYACKNQDLMQEFKGVCPYCNNKGYIEVE